jgi:5-methylcytosine-specific restriction endonuclease McrA
MMDGSAARQSGRYDGRDWYAISNGVRRKMLWRVCGEQNWRCAYCAGHLHLGVNATMDHVVPRSRGGGIWWENIVAACNSCNQRKGDKDGLAFYWTMLQERQTADELAEYHW